MPQFEGVVIIGSVDFFSGGEGILLCHLRVIKSSNIVAQGAQSWRAPWATILEL
jgi:hypothetical protein